MSRLATQAVGACVAVALTVACSAAARQKTLTIFFDGVPPPKAAEVPSPAQGALPTGREVSRQPGTRQHGPYAAKLCTACHDPAAMNALVLPKDELCYKCHDLKQRSKYVHGPLASGGCLVCHDPHGSEYGFLLVASSDSFCFRCHDRGTLSQIEGHGGDEANCTNCHDAHGSDAKYFLK